MQFIQSTMKFFGMVRAVERGDIVTISGVDGEIMTTILAKLFETTAINKAMFNTITRTSLSFERFFVPDLVYMFGRMVADPSVRWGVKRTAEKILGELLANTWFRVSTQEHKSRIDTKILRKFQWKPLPHQVEFLEIFGERIPKYDLNGVLLGAAPGTGKAQPLDAMILTPSGWVSMGDMQPGMEITAHDGGSTKVTNVYPQGVKPIYKLTLQDDRSTECCDDHLWKVRSPSWGEHARILTLKDIRQCKEDIYIPISDLETSDHHYEKLVSIEFVGEKEAQCISVDHPDHLYITDDYIVTHNTFTDLMVATCLIPPEVAEVKIIISPKKAIHLVWADTVRKVFKKTPTYWVSDSGTKMPVTGNEYYIFNFEALDKAVELGKALKAKGVRFFIIVDESHNFADFKSARTQKLATLQTMQAETYFVWASGSPILKSAAELTTFLKCSDKRFTPEAERRFRKIYAASPGRANEIFNHRLGQMMAFMIPKSVVSKTKPKVVERPVKLPPALAKRFLMETVREEMKEFIIQRLAHYDSEMKSLRATANQWLDYHETKITTRIDRREFDQYLKDIKVISKNPDLMIKEVLDRARKYERTKLIPSLPPTSRRAFRHALSAIKNIKLKVRGEALGTVLSQRRAECAAALALYCKPEEIIKESLSKTLFFASSVLPIKTLATDLEKKGLQPLLVYGGTNSQLVSIMQQFATNPNINPVCATMQSLSEAVPVIAASTIVLLNRPYRQAVYDQIVARADRLGQLHQVTVIETTLDTGGVPNVSSRTDEILSNVREIITALIGEEFGGPSADDREYRDVIDASELDPAVADIDELMDA